MTDGMPRYEDAVASVSRKQSASTAHLQRDLKIGYNEASRYIERMEAEGVISAPDAGGARRLLGASSTGHESQAGSDSVSADRLRLFIERIERLEEEKRGLQDDIKDTYGEAKSTGFDVKTIRQIIRLRRMEKHHRDEADALLETYRAALGLA